MCGRYSITTPVEILRQPFRFAGPLPNLPPRYNVGPIQQVPIVRPTRGDGQRELSQVRWGLIPLWAKDTAIGTKMTKVRAEGIAEMRAFRAAVNSRRCLVPADGFYEWRAMLGGKAPRCITLKDGRPFAFVVEGYKGFNIVRRNDGFLVAAQWRMVGMRAFPGVDETRTAIDRRMRFRLLNPVVGLRFALGLIRRFLRGDRQHNTMPGASAISRIIPPGSPTDGRIHQIASHLSTNPGGRPGAYPDLTFFCPVACAADRRLNIVS